MKHLVIVIICISLNSDLSAQIITKIGCDSINYTNQINRTYLEIKRGGFFRSAFIIQDTCFYQNRFIENANQGIIQYFPAYLLTKKEVSIIEKYLYAQLKLRNKNLTKNDTKVLRKEYYRQYVAYVNSKNQIEINIFFCSKKFLTEHLSFKYMYLSPLILTSTNDKIYSSKITASHGFNHFTNPVFRKLTQ